MIEGMLSIDLVSESRAGYTPMIGNRIESNKVQLIS